MPVYRGELKQLAEPHGGGYITTRTHYTDGTSKTTWMKNRMVFPLIHIDDKQLEGLFVATDQLGSDIYNGLGVGEDVCLITFGHLLRKQIIIGARNGDGTWFKMLKRGYFTALLFYIVFLPFIVMIPAVIVGMLVGMIGGKEGSAIGLMLGVLYAVGISWYSAYRFVKAYGEMSRLSSENSHGNALRAAGAGR